MKYLFAILFSVILLSCKQKDDAGVPNEYAAEFVRELNDRDSFLYEVPSSRSKKYDSILLEQKKAIEEDLGLLPLDKGFDSIQLRIFIGGFVESNKLVILKHAEKKWSAELIMYGEIFREAKWVYKYKILKKLSANPKSGWRKFINDLFKLKILTIQDPHQINGFEFGRVFDGWGIDVIMATKNVYRKFGYGNPDEYPEYWQAVNMVEINNLLFEEFETLQEWKKEDEEKIRRIRGSRWWEWGYKKKIKMQEMQIQEVMNEDTSSIKKKKGR